MNNSLFRITHLFSCYDNLAELDMQSKRLDLKIKEMKEIDYKISLIHNQIKNLKRNK